MEISNYISLPVSERSKAVVTDRETCFRKQLLQECLPYVIESTDLESALDYLATSSVLDKQQLARLVLYTCRKLHSGRYALTFQDAINSLITSDDYKAIPKILTFSYIDIYPELFSNAMLTPIEFEQTKARHDKEYAAVVNLLELGISLLEQKHSSLSVSKYTDRLVEICAISEHQHSQTKLVNKCEKDICLYEYSKESEDLVPSYAQTITLEEKNGFIIEQKEMKTKYCFDLLVLISKLSQQPGINPLTGRQFSKETQELLANVFAIELKMYRRYLGMIEGNKDDVH